MKKRLLSIAFVAVLLAASAVGALAPSPVLADEGWVSPDSAYGGDWFSHAWAIDDNTATSARSRLVGHYAWTGYIYFPIASMGSQNVKIYMRTVPGSAYPPPYAYINVIVDVYWSGAWHQVYSGLTRELSWKEFSLGGTYVVTNARVKFKPGVGTGTYYIYLPEFQYQEAFPNVLTLDATNVLDDEARLRGNIDHLAGEETVYAYYQWGTDTDYGNNTAEQEITETGLYHQDLSGFGPEVVYHYRAVIRYDTDKYSYGDDKTFSFASPSADTYSASDKTSTEATLNAYLASMGDYTIAYAQFQYGVGDYANSTDWQTYYNAGPVEADIDELTPGETYQFRVRVKYSGADYVTGGMQTFTTLSEAPSNASATITEDYNELLLSWTKGIGAAETVIKAFTTDFPATHDVGRLVYQGDGTSYVDSHLAGGVTQYYSLWSLTEAEYSDEHCTVSSACSILPGRCEYYNEGDTAAFQVYGSNWASQTFTTTWQHNTESISLLLYRDGEPGTISVSLALTDAAGYSTGDYLVTGTLNGNLITEDTYGLWYEFGFDSVELESHEQYAIVIRATTGDAANYVGVRYDESGELDGGMRLTSSDSAFSWLKHPNEDILFETYSKYLFSILDARVFSGYIEDDDWLIVFTYQNLFYPSGIPSELFDIRLLDGEVVLAKTDMASWGMRPGSVYICASEAAPLVWRSGYTVIIRARFTDGLGNRPTTEYTLQSEDWMGDDLTFLDQWVLSRANSIGDFYTYKIPVGIDADGNIVYDTVVTELTGYTGGFLGIGAKEKLNEQGAVMFLLGIPMLDQQRPDLFLEVPVDLDEGEQTYTHAGDVIDWEDMLGEDTVEMATDLGNVLGMEGKQTAQVAMFGFFLLIACVAAAKFGVAGLGVAAPVTIVGALTGLFPIAALAVGASMIVLAVVWVIWFRGVA